jgi:transglutaminase-like putative cysteine protease
MFPGRTILVERRVLFASAFAASLAPAFRANAVATPVSAGWRRFEITTRVTLPDSPGAAQLWLPLAQTAGDYQVAEEPDVRGNGRAAVVRDDRYGAAILHATWDGTATGQQVQVMQTVATRDRGAIPLAPLTKAERDFWTAPLPTVPTDGIVRETADKITAGHATPRDRLRAIYDWVVETTWRDAKTPGCGTGDFKQMLETNHFGGKCADINGLMVGLARAAGFPARDVYGIRVADSRQFPSIGKSGDISKAQHCRAEVFLDDAGWFPVDPADVRKVVLEQKLPIDHPDVVALRERLFGNWEMNWIGYNSATDIELPGSGQEKSNFSFLMYPCAITATGQPDALDPAHFQYEITSRELSV